jgi:hypothetical protein
MFFKRINRIDLIFFPQLPDEAEYHNSASAEKRNKESEMDAFSFITVLSAQISERLPSKRDDAFCLFSGKAKIYRLSCNPF